jgi:hypothetical protein
MQIDIDEKEAKVLLAGIRMYYANLKQRNEDMLEREYRAMIDEKTYQEHQRKNHKDGKLGFCCCFGDNNHEKYAIDHKMPKCKGGTNTIENLQWIYTPINFMKSGLTHEEFLGLINEIHTNLLR